MVDFFKPVRASVPGRRSSRPGLGVVVGGFVFKVVPSRLQWPAGAGRLQSLGTPVPKLRKVWHFFAPNGLHQAPHGAACAMSVNTKKQAIPANK
jgi:hypothetical protein